MTTTPQAAPPDKPVPARKIGETALGVMRSTKHSSLLAAATIMALGAGRAIAAPEVREVDGWAPKSWKGPKGRSNDKVSKRYKDRDRKKAAHKARMAQKGRK